LNVLDRNKISTGKLFLTWLFQSFDWCDKRQFCQVLV